MPADILANGSWHFTAKRIASGTDIGYCIAGDELLTKINFKLIEADWRIFVAMK